MSDQANLVLVDMGIHYKQVKKTNMEKTIHNTPELIRPFLSFIMMGNPDQDDLKYKHIQMNCKSCVQLSLDLYGIDTSINNQMLNTPHDHLVYF